MIFTLYFKVLFELGIYNNFFGNKQPGDLKACCLTVQNEYFNACPAAEPK